MSFWGLLDGTGQILTVMKFSLHFVSSFNKSLGLERFIDTPSSAASSVSTSLGARSKRLAYRLFVLLDKFV
jgi:hypothetical protein